MWGKPPISFFIDACSGVGTLGIAAACLGVPHVVMNDAWYASAFWSAFNLEVNREYLNISRVKIFEQLQDLQKHPVMTDQIKNCRNNRRTGYRRYIREISINYPV